MASATAAHDAAMAAEMLSAGERIKRAEMKAAAIHAGMIDPDGLKLLDLSTVKMNAAGELEVPEGFFEAAKVAKPYLFGAPVASTSGTAPRPAAAPAVAQKAADMTADEYRIAKALLLKR